MIEVVPLEFPKDVKKFYNFAFKIYKEEPLWVPPLWMDYKKLLSPENPFFKHSKIKLFLALKDNLQAGTIAYIKDDNFNKFHNTNLAYFGFFECINDKEVAKALFEAVEKKAKEDNLSSIIGPLNPSTNEICGLLIWGPPEPPFLMMAYNPNYYSKLIEECSYQKIKDLYAFIAPITDFPFVRLEKIAKDVYKKINVKVRSANLKRFDEELKLIRVIYNEAWEKNWGFVPLEEDEMIFLAKRLKPLCIPELLQIAFVDEEPAGFIMTLPNVNEVFIHLKGHLNPMSLLKLFYFSKKISSLRSLTLGVREKFRKMGIDGCLYYESLKNGLKMKYKRAEFSWILEDNIITQKAVRLMGGKHYKTYRIYTKNLNSSVKI